MTTELKQIDENEAVGIAPNPSSPEETLETRSPEEVEKAALEAERNALENMAKVSPETLGRTTFERGFPEFQRIVAKLSSTELRKLAINLVQYPMLNQNPSFNDAQGREALMLGDMLIYAKYMIAAAREADLFKKNLDNSPEVGDNSNNESVERVLETVETSFEKGETDNV